MRIRSYPRVAGGAYARQGFRIAGGGPQSSGIRALLGASQEPNVCSSGLSERLNSRERAPQEASLKSRLYCLRESKAQRDAQRLQAFSASERFLNPYTRISALSTASPCRSSRTNRVKRPAFPFSLRKKTRLSA